MLQGTASLDSLLAYVHARFFVLEAQVQYPSRTPQGDVVLELRDNSGSHQGSLTIFREPSGNKQSYEITFVGTVPLLIRHEAGEDTTAELSFALAYDGDSLQVLNVCEQAHPSQTRELAKQLHDTGPLVTGAIYEFQPRVARWMPITLTASGALEQTVWARTLGEWSERQAQSLLDPRVESLLSSLQAIRGLCKNR